MLICCFEDHTEVIDENALAFMTDTHREVFRHTLFSQIALEYVWVCIDRDYNTN